jgi:uncharacterized SAM-binding protein YcdF (DUF218 family)
MRLRSSKNGNHGVRRFLRFIVLAFVAWSILAWVMARALMVRAELAHADAVAVLAGADAYRERTREAAQLFAEGRAPKILLTNDNGIGGWSTEKQRNPYFVERAFDELRSAGVPAESIEVLPEAVSSTHDEAVRLREYAAAHNLRSLMVVTSVYHSRRALWTMRRVFRDDAVLIGLDTAATGEQVPGPATWWLHAGGWRVVALEYPKIVYYWLRYN